MGLQYFSLEMKFYNMEAFKLNIILDITSFACSILQSISANKTVLAEEQVMLSGLLWNPHLSIKMHIPSSKVNDFLKSWMWLSVNIVWWLWHGNSHP